MWEIVSDGGPSGPTALAVPFTRPSLAGRNDGSILWSCFWHTESIFFLCFAFFFWRLAQFTRGIMVHSFWCHCKGSGVP